MTPLQSLLNDIEHQQSALLGPKPVAHSQELLSSLPPVRRYWGPRVWYECLEAQTNDDKK